jgi:hypothetical protein
MDTRPPEAAPVTADRQVTSLYQAHALSLARLALLMLGDADVESRRAASATPSGVAGPAGSPRYYVSLGGVRFRGLGIVVGDEQTGRTLGSFPLGAGNEWSGTVSGSADDRTFVVAVAVGKSSSFNPPPLGPTRWYLVRIAPGSADPVRVSKLPIKAPLYEGVGAMALSGDGTELAVESGGNTNTSQDIGRDAGKNVSRTVTLSVYSVATGQLQHSWSATVSTSAEKPRLISDLSWVGDTTVGFAVTYNPQVSEEVRTLDLSSADTNLLTASHVVWSQYVRGPRGDIYHEDTPRACDTPTLTGNGQAVVCGNGIYSARDERVTAVWLAYPLATPTRPRVIGSVLQPKDVSSVSPVTVDWVNTSGTEMIGSWLPAVVTFPGGVKDTDSTRFRGFVGGGMVRQFPAITGPNVVW